MAFDFNKLRKVATADAAPLMRELEEAEWGRYGRNVYRLMLSPRFAQALTTSALRAKDQADLARRMRVFLTTGVIPS